MSVTCHFSKLTHKTNLEEATDKKSKPVAVPYSLILTQLAIVWLLIALVALAFWLLSFVGDIVFLLLLGMFLAVGFSQVADRLSSKLSFLPRWLIIILIYISIIIFIALIIVVVGVPLVSQLRQLIEQYPKLALGLERSLKSFQGPLTSIGIKLPNSTEVIGRATDYINNYGQSLFSGFLSFLLVFSSGISQFILIMVISFYLLIEETFITGAVVGVFAERYRDDAVELGSEIRRIISSFIGGQLLLGLIMGVLAAAFSLLLGIPYAALIGVFVALTGLIPIVGSFLGAILPIIIAYSQAPWKAVAFIIFFSLLSQFVSYYLQPKIVGAAIGLNPLSILIALLIGLELAGFWGAIFAAPVVSIGLALLRHMSVWYRIYADGLSETVKNSE